MKYFSTQLSFSSDSAIYRKDNLDTLFNLLSLGFLICQMESLSFGFPLQQTLKVGFECKQLIWVVTAATSGAVMQEWEEAIVRCTSKQCTTIGTWYSVPLGTHGRWGRTFAKAVPLERQSIWQRSTNCSFLLTELLQSVNSLGHQTSHVQQWQNLS